MMASGSTSTSTEPFTRSRTNLFLSYRQSSSHASAPVISRADKGKGRANYDFVEELDETKSLLRDDDENDLEMGRRESTLVVPPPPWVDVSEEVDKILERLRPKIVQLDKLHAKHVLPRFADRSAEEREISSLTTDITRDFRTAQRLIRQIADMAKAMLSQSQSRSSSSGSETKRLNLILIANVQSGLAAKVQALSGVFRTKQTSYLRQLKGFEDRRGLTFTERSFVLDNERSSPVPLQSQFQSQTLLTPTQSDSTSLDQRDSEISSIAQSITDLSDLFTDLSSLVIDQGTLLDRVDYNVEQMGVEVKAAVEELKTAGSYQKRSGKCQLIFLLLLLIIGSIILLIYRPHSLAPDAPASYINSKSERFSLNDHQAGAGLDLLKHDGNEAALKREREKKAALLLEKQKLEKLNVESRRDGVEENGGSRGSSRFVGGFRGVAILDEEIKKRERKREELSWPWQFS